MTRYWIKIVLGALLIFAVGMTVWFGIRKGASTVNTVMNTADAITIPLKFLSFRVDGASLGSLKQLKLLRAAPKSIVGVQVTVRVDSAAAAERLRSCVLRLDDLENLNEQTSFVCVPPESVGDSSAFQPFGEVLVQGTDISLPLLLPAAAVKDLQNSGWHEADSMAPPPPPVPEAVPVPPTSAASERPAAKVSATATP